MAMKVAVTTPGGRVGSRVVRLLVQAGVRPTVVARDPDRLDDAIRPLVDIAVADQGDADAVVRATAGADALFWVDPPTTQDGSAGEGYARMGANAARAVRESGIGRTVFLSSIGAEKRHGAGDIDGLASTEELLDQTGSSVLHLRCGFFFTNLFFDLDDLREGVLTTTWPLDHRMAWVDPRDIGDVAAARLLSTGWSGHQVQAVHGPADLTFAEVGEIVADVLGRKIRVERVADDVLREALRGSGMGSGDVEGILGMSVGLRSGFDPEQPRDVVTTTPTTLASWAYANLRPALQAA